jgi:hypothetical protein
MEEEEDKNFMKEKKEFKPTVSYVTSSYSGEISYSEGHKITQTKGKLISFTCIKHIQ